MKKLYKKIKCGGAFSFKEVTGTILDDEGRLFVYEDKANKLVEIIDSYTGIPVCWSDTQEKAIKKLKEKKEEYLKVINTTLYRDLSLELYNRTKHNERRTK